jgi:hypothetical protein
MASETIVIDSAETQKTRAGNLIRQARCAAPKIERGALRLLAQENFSPDGFTPCGAAMVGVSSVLLVVICDHRRRRNNVPVL